MRTAQQNPLRENHLADLRKSGLSDSHIAACGFYSATLPAEIAKLINWKSGCERFGPCLVIPYFDAQGRPTGYYRIRPDAPRPDAGKYEAPAGLPIRAYFPPRTRPVLFDPSVPLIGTEGEKKAAAADQHGFACFGLAGVDSWSRKREKDGNGKPQGTRELIDDLAAIPWEGRVVTIVFDSDAATNPNVLRAETSFALALEKKGAVVKVVRLPPGPDGVKQGIDDYLVRHGPEALRELLRSARPVQRVAKPQLPEYTPFPVEALPQPVKDFAVQTARALGCDVAFVVMPLLAVLAAGVGNSRVIRVKRSWDEPCIIWSAVVAESGTLKTPAFKKVVWYLYRLQKRLIKEHAEAMVRYQERMQEFKAAKKAFEAGDGPDPGPEPEKPVCKRIITDNITIEKLAELLEDNPRGILSARDELASWFSSFTQYKSGRGESDMARWLESYCAGCWLIDRKTGEKRSYFVDRVSVSITGTIQPGTLARALTPEFLHAGGASRLLMTMPQRMRKRWTEEEVPEETERAYHDLLDKFFGLELDRQGGELVPHVVRMSAEAKSLWTAFYDEWAGEQTEVEGEMAACYSKLEGVALRLALIHHVVTHLYLEIDDLRMVGRRSMEAGITLARWFAREAERIYGMLGESRQESKTRTLVEFIRRKGGRITTKELQRSNSRKYRTAEAAEVDLQGLVLDGLARWEPQSAGPKGGRPSRVCVLRPTADETDETPSGALAGNSQVPDETSDETPVGPQNLNGSEGFVGNVGSRNGFHEPERPGGADDVSSDTTAQEDEGEI